MKEVDIDELINFNYRICTLLGIATAMIAGKEKGHIDKKWFLEAIQKVIYENKPLPSFPE